MEFGRAPSSLQRAPGPGLSVRKTPPAPPIRITSSPGAGVAVNSSMVLRSLLSGGLGDPGRGFRLPVMLVQSAAADWTNITGNPNPLPGSPNPPLSNDLRTIELFTATPAPGDDVILVGGAGGVFRTLNPGAGAVWSELGALPNSIVKDLHYDATDDLLLAGTWGRGAWTISNAAAAITTAGVLQINGDTDFAGEDDTIRLMRETANPSLLDVFLNSARSEERRVGKECR